MRDRKGWRYVRRNYYGGEIWVHPDGFRAIECFNYYNRSIGYEIWDENRNCLGICKELP